MNRQLRERRDRAAGRHDAALNRFPTREGEAFQRELKAVINELTAVVRAADEPSSDPVEVAKTYRWLGDAYFDLGLGKDETALTQGSQAYHRAEELLAAAEAPIEKAKLDFNYGNTLRGLSEGFDVGLLEAAQTRYENAVRTFRTHHLPDLAATVEQQLRSIDPQLRLARKHAGMQRGYNRLAELQERLKSAGPAEREQIARELQSLKKAPSQGDLKGTLNEALDAVREQIKTHPERIGDKSEKMRTLMDQIAGLSRLLPDTPPSDLQDVRREEAKDSDQEIARALMERLQKEAATGKVSADRAAHLGDILKQFTAAMSEGGDDLQSMAARAHKMRQISQLAMDAAMKPSWPTPDPAPGSRAHRAVSVLEPLKRHLLAESGRGMLPSEETSAGTELLTRLIKLEARIREVVDDEEKVKGLEGELWRLAPAIQEHSRRYHLTLARPIFATTRMHAEPKSLFLSGGDELCRIAGQLTEREELQLFEQARHGDRAQERWNQLCSTSVAVFDLGVPEGAPRAQVCYELGLALALGKPTVVAVRPGQKLPFDVNLQPISLGGDAAVNARVLEEALQQALGSIVWGGAEAGLGTGPDDALAWLDRHLGRRLSGGNLKVAMDLVRGARDDAVAFRRSLDQLLGMLGADAPAALLPAWPPAYPDPTTKLRLFHVMPFRPRWARPTRDLAKAVCDKKGWRYVRGDEAEEQRIIRGIWSEIGRASAVLIDITGHNPNVALELGLVHALGCRYRVIGQGESEMHMFDSLEKVQVHSYGKEPGYRGFKEEVEKLLASSEV